MLSCMCKEAGGGGEGGEGARDTESKTRTPHKDVGKKHRCVCIYLKFKSPFRSRPMDFPLDQGEVRTPTAAGSARVAWPMGECGRCSTNSIGPGKDRENRALLGYFF